MKSVIKVLILVLTLTFVNSVHVEASSISNHKTKVKKYNKRKKIKKGTYRVSIFKKRLIASRCPEFGF